MTIAILLAGAGFAVARMSKPKSLKYQAYVTSNPSPGICYDKVALYVGLQVTVPRAKAPKLAAANKPTSASVRIHGKTYRLAIDPGSSGAGNGEVAWGYKPIGLSKSTSLKLIGKPTIIKYKVGKKAYTSQPTKVKDGRCKSLI